LDGDTPVRGLFTGEPAAWHIKIKEVAAIWRTLTALGNRVSTGDRLRIFTDSQVALHTTNALVSRSPTLCAEVRRLHAVAQDLGVTLDAEWIPTAENVWADKLSRAEESTDWQVDRTFFDTLDFKYGPHTIDRFGTACNTMLPHCNSPDQDFSDLPADALSQQWGGGHNNWINPPFDRIPLVLDKIKTDVAKATVVLPVWRTQPWWTPALTAADEVCCLPRRADLFFRAAAGAQAPRPHWTLRPPVHTRRAGPAAATWTRAATAVGRHKFGAGLGGAQAAAMLADQLADSTKDAYAIKWANFVGFCEASGYPFLQTTTEVVACRVGELYERGKVAPGTLQNYLTPINAVNALYRMDKPAVGPLLLAVTHRYARRYADAHDGLRDKRTPLPAAALMRMVGLGGATPDPALRRRMAGLALSALTLCRPGGGANLRLQDVTLKASHLLIQVPKYKHGARANPRAPPSGRNHRPGL